MKSSEWRLFTIASALAVVAFPPYFLQIVGITMLGGMGYLWRTLKDTERRRLQEFEKEFRPIYEGEKKRGALKSLRAYEKLAKKYESSPLIAKIALKRAETLAKAPKKKSPKRKAKSPKRRR